MITVTIPSETYFELLDDVRLLEILMAQGVDNWEGWEEALRIYGEEEDDPT